MHAVILPVFRPDGALVKLARELAADGLGPVVVDDGSGPGYESVFSALPERTRIIRNTARRGVGAAIKAAMKHIKEHMPDCKAIATVSSPARYCAAEIRRVLEHARDGALVLGSRMLSKKAPVAARAKFSLERRLFSMTSGKNVDDIRTGLCVIGRNDMDMFTNVPGDGGDFEINALVSAARSGMEIVEVPLGQEDMPPRGESWKDMAAVYKCAALFLASSLFAFGLEFALLVGLRSAMKPLGEEMALLIAVILSRVISCVVNYETNRRFVFKSAAPVGGSFFRYVLVAALVLVVNYALIRFCVLVMRWPMGYSKVAVESLLFFLNFALQGLIVYRE